MNYLIEEQSQLDGLSLLFSRLSEDKGVVSVDTEFFREKTYNAKLCLVQLGIGDDQYCIDVLTINDLTLLIDLLADQRVTKLFHAARQDLEVIYQTLNVIPKPIFDTQLAAAFCGLDMQIGYAALVEKQLGIKLEKSQGRTDWTRRPLSDAQINYAGEDVAYLEALYRAALKQLEETNKLNWLYSELDGYYQPDFYVVEPANAYKRLSGGALNIEQQYVLKALAQWREESAQKRDIPRTWVLRDDKLFDLAFRLPKTKEEVIKLRAFSKKSMPYLAPEAAKLISSVKVGNERLWNKVEPFDKHQKSICSAMMNQLKHLAEQQSVAQGLLGTRKDIESLFRHRRSKKLLSGWRKEVVGQPLLDFLENLV